MGTFLLISVLVHLAVMLFAPPIVNRAGAQFPSLLSGGVVQVVRVDEPVASQRTTPQRVAQERRPAPAQRQNAQTQAPTQTSPQTERESQNQTERPSTPAQRPEPQASPEPAIQAPAKQATSEPALTSPQGAEPAPTARTSQPAAQRESQRAAQPSSQPEPAEPPASSEAGTAKTAEPGSEPVPGEPGPPALPPLGEPNSLLPNLGGAGLGYPKNAENEGLEGAVEVRLELDASGKVQRVLLVRPSGHRVLDEYAMRALTARMQNLRGTNQAAPYAVHARVVFRREGNAFVGHVELVGTAEYLQER